MRAWLLTSLLVAVALSGCAGEEPRFEPEGPLMEADGADGNETLENLTVPMPLLLASADVVNGTAPLLVNFTVDLDGAADNVTWAFLVDGNETLAGAAFPATFNHTFDAGLWNVTLSIARGNETAFENLTIEAVGVVEDAFEPVHLEQDILGACPHCIGSDVTASATCLGFQAGEQGVDCWWFDIDPSWIGRTLTVDGGFMMGIEFETSCDGSGTVVGSYLSEEQVIPEGAGCVFILDIVDPVITATADIA